ncbi:MAG: acyltransferase [Bacteroidota bacterium]
MGKIKYLEGLRGVAALIVVFGHLRNICFWGHQTYLISCINNLSIPGFLRTFLVNIINICTDGSLAVWIFWVLSSYVISILFFKEGANYDQVLVNYFSKRYFRLLIPVLASVMFAYILLKFGLMYNLELAAVLPTYASDGWIATFYNFSPDFLKALKSAFFDSFFAYDKNTTYNTVLWTIQNEFLGSLFTFSIFGIIRHNKRRYILYFIIMAVALKLYLGWLVAFVIGHVLCDFDFSKSDDKILTYLRNLEAKIHRRKILVLIATILFIVFNVNLMSALHIHPVYGQLILSAFIVYICCKSPYLKSFFSLKIPVWLGKISFGLYLIHLPIICSLTSYLILQSNSLVSKIGACVLTLVVSLVLSYFFTTFIDRNGVTFANRIGNYFKRYT